MIIGDKLSGFILKDKCYIEEIDGTLHTFIHQRCGTVLYYLDREDECKTFAIGFKTIPKDDTGVFHILEHSVLCGSEKYPVKDPFTEVMKGSVNVYMNAFTSPDKTYYPIATRNEQDLYNLIDVYMHSVLHPLAVKDKNIFLREGIRIEPGEDGEPRFNGVVYNEMTGAYSKVEEQANYLSSRLLYPNGCYSFDTGGNPDSIPLLTFDNFCAAYREFYHPSNACIFLDGKMDFLTVISLLDGYLEGYDYKQTDSGISLGTDVITEKTVKEYAIEENEDECNKGYLYLCHRISSFQEVEKNTAASILADCLSDSNDAPLKKAVLELGLCDNFYLSPSTDLRYGSMDIEFVNVKDGREDELVLSFEKICKRLTEEGVSRRLIEASINFMEFKAREADYGSSPRGMVYMSACLDGWSYGVHPKELLSYGKVFTALREKLDTDYFKNLIGELLLPEKQTKLLMLPSKALYSKESARRAAECQSIVAGMTEEELMRLRQETEEFNIWQSAEDEQSALDKIPRLSLSDLSEAPKETPTEIVKTEGVTVLRHPIHTSGIIYTELHFDVSDISAQDIPALQLFTMILSDMHTESGAPSIFRTRKKAHLGSLYCSVEPVKRHGEPKLYLVVRGSALVSKSNELADCIREYIYTANFCDPEAIRKKVMQISAASPGHIASAGTSYALQRAAARYDRFEALKELAFGFSFRKWIRELDRDFSLRIDGLISFFNRLRDECFVRPRATLTVTSPISEEFERKVICAIPEAMGAVGKCTVSLLPKINEGICAATHTGYSVRASNLSISGKKYTGSLATLSSLLGLGLLLEEIRLKGGAYDTGFIARSNSGTLAAYSYRDPTPQQTVEIFSTLGERIRSCLDASPDLTGYIISTVGNLDGMTTPRQDGSAATLLYLSGITYSDTLRIRKEAIGTDISELYRLSELLDEVQKASTVCIVAAKDKLLSLGNRLNAILEL